MLTGHGRSDETKATGLVTGMVIEAEEGHQVRDLAARMIVVIGHSGDTTLSKGIQKLMMNYYPCMHSFICNLSLLICTWLCHLRL